MSKRKNRKTLMTEKLPDPKSAAVNLLEGDARGRTAAHLKRILAAGLSLPLAAGVTACSVTGYQVVDPVPPPAVIPQAFGTLKVKAPLLVTINGRSFQSLMTPTDGVAIASGVHTIQLSFPSDRNSGAFAIELSIALSSSRTPGTQPPPTGIFKPLSAANIQVDGKPATLVPPQGSVELSAGTHTIEISPSPASSTHSFSLEIRPGPQNPGQ
jgi:hypothetical protein